MEEYSNYSQNNQLVNNYCSLNSVQYNLQKKNFTFSDITIKDNLEQFYDSQAMTHSQVPFIINNRKSVCSSTFVQKNVYFAVHVEVFSAQVLMSVLNQYYNTLMDTHCVVQLYDDTLRVSYIVIQFRTNCQQQFATARYKHFCFIVGSYNSYQSECSSSAIRFIVIVFAFSHTVFFQSKKRKIEL